MVIRLDTTHVFEKRGNDITASAYVSGALFWLLFSVVAVVVRGPHWEESFQFAQVLLGQIAYPQGHPMVQHANNLFCIQTYLSAALMWLDPNPVLTCGYRNVLHIFAKLLPFFLFGTLLSRRIIGGHMAALLAFLAGQGFWNAYPSYVWPESATNGVIGLGFAMLTLFFFAADRPRIAFALVGAMPAVHIGQFPPVLAVGGGGGGGGVLVFRLFPVESKAVFRSERTIRSGCRSRHNGLDSRSLSLRTRAAAANGTLPCRRALEEGMAELHARLQLS